MQADARVPVLVVVVGEEDVAEVAGLMECLEAAGEGRAVFEGLELRFGVRVIVRHVRPGVAAADLQVRQQAGDRLRGHRGAVAGVDAAGGDTAIGGNGISDEFRGEYRVLGRVHLLPDRGRGGA